MGLVALQEEEREVIPSPPCEDTVRRRLSASQEEGSHQELASTLILDFLVCRGHNFHTHLLSASHCRIVWVSPGPMRVQTDHINCLSLSLHFLHLNDDPSWALTHWKWQWVDSLRPYEWQHARLLCPSLSLGICSNSCPLCQWCHPTISPSVNPFSSCPQSFSASESFPMSQFFPSGGQSIGASVLQHQSLQWIFRVDFI